jgi:hypothetical protein
MIEWTLKSYTTAFYNLQTRSAASSVPGMWQAHSIRTFYTVWLDWFVFVVSWTSRTEFS